MQCITKFTYLLLLQCKKKKYIFKIYLVHVHGAPIVINGTSPLVVARLSCVLICGVTILSLVCLIYATEELPLVLRELEVKRDHWSSDSFTENRENLCVK